MAIKLLDADFYFIAPFSIADFKAFENDFNTKTNKWLPKSDSNNNALRNFIPSFLGEDEATEFPMKRGLAFRGRLQQSGDKTLSSLKGCLQFYSPKGLPLQEDNKLFEISSNEVVVHIAPDRKTGLAYIRLKSVSPLSLDEAVFYNYHLHKIDRKQIPHIYTQDKNKEWQTTEGRQTLLEIISGMLPKNSYALINEARFISAVYLRIDVSEHPDEVLLINQLTRLSLAKGEKYQITNYDCIGVTKLFDNIWAHSSSEGLATFVLSKEPANEAPFFRDFGDGSFRKSYFPLFLTAILADNCLKEALRHLDTIADDIEEQDRLRELHLIQTFEPSNYVHLNKFMESIIRNRQFEVKYQAVLESIEARKVRNESIRLNQEKEKQLQQEKRDRTINYLLGFIGIGQVVFAILELAGAETIFGEFWARSRGLMTISIIFVSIFSVLIVLIVAYLFKITSPRSKSDHPHE